MSQQTQGACGGEPRGPRHRGRAPRRGDITAATGNAQVHVAAAAEVAARLEHVVARDAERAFLVQKLRENGWNISKTAEVIDTPRSNLYKKLEQYQISQETDG